MLKFKFSGHDPSRLKSIPDLNHFIFEINVGKSRIRHKTTRNLNFQIYEKSIEDDTLKFSDVSCRIRLFPTLI